MGIAKMYRKDKTIIDSSGTPGYMSPEVIINTNHDLSSDFFAIGVMLHEFMFTKRPYVGKSRKEIKEQIINKEINIKVSEVPPGWSIEAADLITRLLKRRPQHRLGKNGIHEVKDHSWLKDVEWAKLYKKELMSPFIPKVI
jgi:serine/threonine protein kinase